MKKLIAMFKGLPPELRMMLALAGLASPMGAIYLLQRFLFPGVPTLYIIMGVAVAVGVICLIAFLISKFFSRGTQVRTQRMASELARDDRSGPTSMDVRASIKANNEKFFSAIRDMRKNLNISVYDLPWYIVIGDSGCGKTRLVNNGGLTFSTGRPEGYQLGTLNYNWWFTEDAVFVDMAGRLCNPQEDSDYREWQAFLDTIARGRRGFPINGAVVCVSAEHLLQDSPEKHEADANTALERLREMQTKLGVTFATYLVITKCDKILGFMQFFDRAERDITVKNQIFGWSKPGAFNTLYDPENFKTDFEELYGRLNDLRLRRLHDEVSELDLGLAYSFPEEFREVREPLQTYVRTLFPPIKNPRAVKNLIFRGIYFTSATQEGEVILKHLSERLGAEAAGQFPTLDSLYPEKRPLFVKDVFFRKMFPEHGLVFRNEDDVVRNRKLAKLLKYGSAALAVLLITAVVWSSLKMGQLVVQPGIHAKDAHKKLLAASDALGHGALLEGDVDLLRRNRLPAMILSFGFGADQPIHDLTTVRVKLFEDGVLRHALADITTALRTTVPPDPALGKDAALAGESFLKAWEHYLAWLACSEDATVPSCVTYDSFTAMCAIVTAPESSVVMHRKALEAEARAFFTTIAAGGDWANPARLLTEVGDRDATVRDGTRNVYQYLSRYARLDERHPNTTIAEWMRLRERCRVAGESYGEILDASSSDPATREELQALKTRFLASYQAFSNNLDECVWKGPSTGFRTVIDPIREAIKHERRQWLAWQKRFEDAYARCSPGQSPRVSPALGAIAPGDAAMGIPGLDREMWKNLMDAGLVSRAYGPDSFEHLDELLVEVPVVCGHLLTLKSGDGTSSDEIQLTQDAQTVRGVVRSIRDRLAAAQLEPAADDVGTPAQWVEEMNSHLDEAFAEPPLPATVGELGTMWRAEELADLDAAHHDWILRGVGTRLLATIQARLTATGAWGFSELLADEERLARTASAYSIAFPEPRTMATSRRTAPSAETPAEAKPTRRQRPRGTRRGGSGSTPRAPRDSGTRPRVEAAQAVPACVSRRFLDERVAECADLHVLLREFNEDFYFRSADEDRPLHEVCLSSLGTSMSSYFELYVQSWIEAYRNYSLQKLDDLFRRNADWKSLADRLKTSGPAAGGAANEIADEFRSALEEILAAVPLWSWWKNDAGSWEPGTSAEPEWTALADWMHQAVQKNRPADGGQFFDRATVPAEDRTGGKRGTPPWQLLSDEFVRLWDELCRSIGRNAALPRTYDRNTARAEKIPWGQIESLRHRAGLYDEKLTGQLRNFEATAQDLLSRELTNVLFEIQNRHLQGSETHEGWPYLVTDGEPLNALRTVDFEKFTRFLVEVDMARAALEPLENDLPADNELRQSRLAFYDICRRWLEFIGLQERSDKPGIREARDLFVEIRGADPKEAPFGKEQPEDTPHSYYKFVELNLGLEVESEPGVYRDERLRVATETEKKIAMRKARWRWISRPDDVPVTAELVEGYQPETAPRAFPQITRTLGRQSPLALCAYLYRYGIPTGADWVVSHNFDLGTSLEKKNEAALLQWLTSGARTKIVGDKYIFRFVDRPMPGPIRRLERAPDLTRTTSN